MMIIFLARNSCREKQHCHSGVSIPLNSNSQVTFTTHFPTDIITCQCSKGGFSLSLQNKFIKHKSINVKRKSEHALHI